ncbi:MAG: hypothetical protein KA371_04890 [Acidobacteria bacterium]|nr:hypothetical protein [Acidobacteriota bacterium]
MARRWLLAVLVLGICGMATELVLLAHYEELDQLIPLGLGVAGLAVLAWVTVAPGPASVAATKAVMAGFVVSGAVGVWLHFQANAEFQHDIDPALAGLDLVWKVLQAKAPPALAPGAMVQLGLLGWLYAVLQGSSSD